MMPEFPAQVDLKFVCADHDLIMDTVDRLVAHEATCHFCGASPIVIVYRSLIDKIVTACKEHRDIVEEMIERDKA
jgi:hypothetical protein